jgi:hypothetical protein
MKKGIVYFRTYGASVSIFLVLVVILILTILFFDPFRGPFGEAGIENIPSTLILPSSPPLDGVNQELVVWVETDPSMYGFLAPSPSCKLLASYRLLLDDALKKNDIANAVGLRSPTTAYAFDAKFVDAMFENAGEGEAGGRKIQRDALFDSKTYEKTGSKSKLSPHSSVAAVLKAVDPQFPTLIFTDFEDIYAQGSAEEIRDAAEHIFLAERFITVMGFESAFGGILYDYRTIDKNDYYGLCAEDSSLQLNSNNHWHRAKRPFYIIIVGTETECAKLRDACIVAYKSHRTEVETSAKGEGNHLPEGSSGKYNEEYKIQEFSFPLMKNTVHEVDEQYVRIPDEDNVRRIPRKDGVLHYEIIGDNVAGFNIPLVFIPALDDWNEGFIDFTATVEVEHLKSRRIEGEEYDSFMKNVKTRHQVTPGYARHGTVRLLEVFSDENEWFVLDDNKVQPNNAGDGLRCTLRVNAKDCAPGEYRVMLKVEGKRRPQLDQMPKTALWIGEWSISSSALQASSGKKEDWPKRTVDLALEAEAMRNAIFNAQNGADKMTIAEIMVDITKR